MTSLPQPEADGLNARVASERGPDVVVGLGANLGRPLESFRQAARMLEAVAPIRAYSRVYRSPAQGFSAQPDFANAAILLRSSVEPDALLATLLGIERRLGRRRGRRFGPRLIDLDLLWVEGTVRRRLDLTLPHPRLTQRAFALVPLLDVAPGATDPCSGRPYTTWLPGLRNQALFAWGEWKGSAHSCWRLP